jgi:predicted transcriptional regulator
VIRQAIGEYLDRNRREEPTLPLGLAGHARGKQNG